MKISARRFLYAIGAIGILAVSSQVAQATIEKMSSPALVVSGATVFYAAYDGGDVIFQVQSGTPANCVGLWLRGSDAGHAQSVALLLSAITTQTPILVTVDTSQLWPGSPGSYCLVYNITI
jgi:hypothetical protein